MTYPVIVGIDDPDLQCPAVDWAADEARLRGLGLRLVQAGVWAADPASSSLGEELVRESNEQALQGLAARVAARHPDLEITHTVLDTPVREALTTLSSEAALLVLGTRGRGGFEGLLVGSTALSVSARAVCPVVVVRDSAASGGGVLVGVRGKEPCDDLLAFAFEEAQRRELPLRVLHAWTYPLVTVSGQARPPVYEEGHMVSEQSRLLAEILAGWRQKFPEVKVAADAVRGGAARALVEASSGERLAVVARRRDPSGPIGRLGSVSQAVVHHAHCPVAVLPAP